MSLITSMAVLTKLLGWWQNMEERELNISFSKSGSGSYTPRISLPATWIKDMGIDVENREVLVSFENEEITIKKAK